jgi:murein DD-endopeptidase MepM/ murein hydrolase activator NlpD
VRGRVAGSLAGVIALFIAVPTQAGAEVPPDPIEQPGKQALPAPSSRGGAEGVGSVPAGAPTGRPVLTLFNVSPAAVAPAAGDTVVRFRVRDRARRVRVRLAFVSLADGTTYRVNLGGRRTGRVHTYSWSRAVAAGSYRVRITARNPRGRKAVRSTTMQVTPRTPAVAGAHSFPIAGAYAWGGSGSRFGAARNGHRHQGQDLAADEGTPLVAVTPGTISWRAYQSGGAGHYLVLDADGEDYNYVYMHLQSGSLLVGKGDRVTAGQHIANVGNTGSSEGPHLHFEIWDGPWYDGGHPVDPYDFLKSWE